MKRHFRLRQRGSDCVKARVAADKKMFTALFTFGHRSGFKMLLNQYRLNIKRENGYIFKNDITFSSVFSLSKHFLTLPFLSSVRSSIHSLLT